MTDSEIDLPDTEDIVRADYSFDYARIPKPLRLGTKPGDMITLFKGGKRGFETRGIWSYATQNGDSAEVERIKRMIQRGNLDEIRQELDRHISAHPDSGFVSTTLNPQFAQVFAPSGYMCDNTIYRIEVAADRCILDVWDTGNAGKSKEILVLGMVRPREIRAVKTINDSRHSELLTRDDHGAISIPFRPDPDSFADQALDPANWRSLP